MKTFPLPVVATLPHPAAAPANSHAVPLRLCLWLCLWPSRPAFKSPKGLAVTPTARTRTCFPRTRAVTPLGRTHSHVQRFHTAPSCLNFQLASGRPCTHRPPRCPRVAHPVLRAVQDAEGRGRTRTDAHPFRHSQLIQKGAGVRLSMSHSHGAPHDCDSDRRCALQLAQQDSRTSRRHRHREVIPVPIGIGTTFQIFRKPFLIARTGRNHL